MPSVLTSVDHSRDSAGLTYVYPVMSRRAGGLSIGINLNTNNACNWRCIYCQVPDLTLGTAPAPDLNLLAGELRAFLAEVRSGEFYRRFNVPAAQQTIKDIAISGNGEPTSVPGFAASVACIGALATEAGVFPRSRFVLITNGSLIHQRKVQEGLLALNRFGGEIWFKFDSATKAGRQLLNGSAQSAEAALQNLIAAARLCQTAVQICLVDVDRQGFPAHEKRALLDALAEAGRQADIRRVMLYTIARPSLQPGAERLLKMPAAAMSAFADDLRALDYEVSISD